MTDLAEQLRVYIDGVAAPVALDDVRAPTPVALQVEPRRRRSRRRVLVALVAAVLVLALVGLLAIVRTGDDHSLQPARANEPHGRALKVTGPSPCSAAVEGGGTQALNVLLSNGLEACVAGEPGARRAFVDGQEQDVAAQVSPPVGPPLITQLFKAPSGTDHVTTMYDIGVYVAVVRFTFCDGTLFDVVPFVGNGVNRFVAIETDPEFGTPGVQLFDGASRPVGVPTTGLRPGSADGAPTACRAGTAVTTPAGWSVQPVTILDGPDAYINSVAANDERVVASTGPFPQAFVAGPDLSALTVTTRTSGASYGAMTSWSGGFVAAGFSMTDTIVTPTPVGQATTTPPTTSPSPSQPALIMSSPDGITWRQADTAPFVPTRHDTSLDSQVVAFGARKGLLVAVGAFSVARGGRTTLQPALWTSRDGLRWKRRVLDLGSGSSTSLSSITWCNGQWVATGNHEQQLVSWTSRDLVDWEAHPIADRAGARVAVADGTLYATGSVWSGARTAPTFAPTVWRSTDGVHWRAVLSLPASAAASPLTTVLPSDAGLVVLLSSGPNQTTAPALYTSGDGTRWTSDPGAAALFPPQTTFTASALIHGRAAFVGLSAGTAYAWSAP